MNAAAIVVRWRGGDEVDRCLVSLLDYGGDRLSKIVLVDSGSRDGGAERLASKFPDIDVVALDENHSFAHAANTGIATTEEKLVFLLNPDTEIRENCVSTLIAGLKGRPGAAGAVPLLINPDGSSQVQWQLRNLPTAWHLATGRPGTPACSRPPIEATLVEQPAAAAWLVRREVWDHLGGFEESFAPAWWEDVDFCARLADGLNDPAFPSSEGFVMVPDARVLHSRGSSVSELRDETFLTAYYGNLLRYATQHHENRLALIGPALRLSLMTRGLLKPSRRRAYFAVSHHLY